MTMPIVIPWTWLLALYVANQVFTALVQSLPNPDGSSKFYTFIFKFLSLLIADFKSFTQDIPTPLLKQQDPKA